MYHNMLLEEAKEYQRGLDHLLEIEPQVTDKRAWKEKKALYLYKLDRKEEAEAAYRVLISENPNHVEYIKALLTLQGKFLFVEKRRKNIECLVTDNKDAVLADLFAQYPRSRAVEHLILEHAQGDSFKVKVATTLQNGLRKGVPSLFAFMKKHYADSEKKKIIEGLVQSYAESLSKDGTFGTEDGAKEPPTALLWTLYYLAKQYDLYKDTDKALDYINKAIAHTPTVVELYMTKGRILKHAGKVEEASVVMNDAREIDLQDRFINSKCAKYMLRAGKIEEAERILGLFTRKEVPALQDLTDMQCQWVMIEEGNAYLRKKEYGKALKRFHAIQKFYSDYFEDQFDFHNYCLRKFTLRAYVDALRWEDRAKAHPFYLKAAKGAVEAYLAIAKKAKGEHEELDESKMTEAEIKKAKNKARKAALKAQQDQEAKKAQAKEEALKHKHDKKPVDLDPEGEQYLETKTPLEDALQFVKPLEKLAPHNNQVQQLAFDVYFGQEKYVLAAGALVKMKGHENNKNNADRLKAAVESKSDLDPKLKQVIEAQLKQI